MAASQERMKKKVFTLIILLFISISIFSQNERKILGTWIKTGMETVQKKSTPFIKERNKKLIKYTFERFDKMYISSVFHEKGNQIAYRIQNNIIDLLFNKFKIEKLDNEQLILIELENNQITSNSTRIYFVREQLYLDKLPLNENDIFIEGNDSIYFETTKVYPKFHNKDKIDVTSFIQPFVEGRSNRKEYFSYSTFIVNTNGTVSDVKIHHHINKSYDKNLKKAILKTNGMWISPNVNGKKVKVLKEIKFHYILFPDIKKIKGKLEVQTKKSNISKSYELLFKKATKEYLKGNLENALNIYSSCNDLSLENLNIKCQENLIYKKLNDSLNYEISKKIILNSKLKYVLKMNN